MKLRIRKNPDLFLVAPYVQLGASFLLDTSCGMEVIWHASNEDARWELMVLLPCGARCISRRLQPARTPVHLVDAKAVPAHSQYRVVIPDLMPGRTFTYFVLFDDVPVFAARCLAPRPCGQPFRFVAVGDIGEGSTAQRKVAYQVGRFKPDCIVAPGDITYRLGRVSEYLRNFFPILNNDCPSPDKGAPLLRSIPFIAALGNHDVARPEINRAPSFDLFPDMLGYFIFWSQPLNGPLVGERGRNTMPLAGSDLRQHAFLEASDGRYPRMASYSFDYADAHFLTLDANSYVDWADADMREWVRQDLEISGARWKFIIFHQPPFTSHVRDGVEQQMRLLHDIFQSNNVSLAFCGHAHWYERSYPLKFKLGRVPEARIMPWFGPVDGELFLDKEFDGVTHTVPDGLIYVITGGGGGKLQLDDMPEGSWQPFTYKLVADRHSFTVVDVQRSQLTVRQIDDNGLEIDRFVVTSR
jgi:3',5'-cyclic AMP phosphodiesterase CpdA